MAKEAISINADTFQFFTRNPRGGKAKAIDENDVDKYIKLAEEHRFGKVVAHAPYTLNPCSKDAKTREFAYMAMTDDLKRMEYIPGKMCIRDRLIGGHICTESYAYVSCQCMCRFRITFFRY